MGHFSISVSRNKNQNKKNWSQEDLVWSPQLDFQRPNQVFGRPEVFLATKNHLVARDPFSCSAQSRGELIMEILYKYLAQLYYLSIGTNKLYSFIKETILTK